MKLAIIILIALATLVPATAYAHTPTIDDDHQTPSAAYVQVVPSSYCTSGLSWITWGNYTYPGNSTPFAPYAVTGESGAGTPAELDHADYFYYRISDSFTEFCQVRRQHFAPWFNNYLDLELTAGQSYDYYFAFKDWVDDNHDHANDGDGTMTTIPAGSPSTWFTVTVPPTSATDFDVAVYSDLNIHTGGSGYDQITSGGAVQSRTENNVFEDFRTMGADLSIFCDDAYSENGSHTVYEYLTRANTWAESYAKGLMSLKCFGDNDNSTDAGAQAIADNMLQNGYSQWATYDYGDVHFVILDTSTAHAVPPDAESTETLGLDTFNWSGSGSPSFTAGSEQAEWLEGVLDGFTSGGTSDANIVVVMHQPLKRGKYGNVSERPWQDTNYSGGVWSDAPGRGDNANEREDILDMFAYYGVDLVLTGHTHVYRDTPIIVTKNSTPYYLHQIQIPPIQSNPRTVPMSSDGIPDDNLASSWQLGAEVYHDEWNGHTADTHNSSDYHGFLKLSWDATNDQWTLNLYEDVQGRGSWTPSQVLGTTPTFSAIPTGSDYDQYTDGSGGN